MWTQEQEEINAASCYVDAMHAEVLDQFSRRKMPYLGPDAEILKETYARWENAVSKYERLAQLKRSATK